LPRLCCIKLGSDGPIIEIPQKEKLWNFNSAKEASNGSIGTGAQLKHEFTLRTERSQDREFLVFAYGVITSFIYISYLEASFVRQIVPICLQKKNSGSSLSTCLKLHVTNSIFRAKFRNIMLAKPPIMLIIVCSVA
jgi:hypothetical protein